jgi:hypothetical protein
MNRISTFVVKKYRVGGSHLKWDVSIIKDNGETPDDWWDLIKV